MSFRLEHVVLIILGSFALGALIHRFGGRQWRSWAAPVTGALLFGGLGWVLDLPDWAVIGGLLLTPFIFHRTVRSRLESTARRMPSVKLNDGGLVLRRIPDPMGKLVALWTTAAEGGKGAGEEPLMMALDFIGEQEEEYEVVLWTQAHKHLPGELVIHHRDAEGEVRSRLSSRNAITGILGMPIELEVRSFPDDYAFRVFDTGAVAALSDLFALRSDDRELYVHVLERHARIVSTATFKSDELARLLPSAAALFQKVLATLNAY